MIDGLIRMQVDTATCVRIRWYGERNPSKPDQKLFVERKLHRDAITGEVSTKVGMLNLHLGQ